MANLDAKLDGNSRRKALAALAGLGGAAGVLLSSKEAMAAQIGSKDILYVGTINELTTLNADGNAPDAVIVAGYHEPGDGGGGTFLPDPGGTDFDRGTMLPAANGSGRWIRVRNNPIITAREYGCVPEDGVDNVGRLEQALELATPLDLPVDLGGELFDIDETLIVNYVLNHLVERPRLQNGGLRYLGTGVAVQAGDWASYTQVELRDLRITTPTGSTGIHTIQALRTRFENVHVTGFDTGILIQGANSLTVQASRIMLGGTGIELKALDDNPCTDVRILDCIIAYNSGAGILAAAAPPPAAFGSAANRTVVFGCAINNQDDVGIDLDNGASWRITECSFEHNVGHHVHIRHTVPGTLQGNMIAFNQFATLAGGTTYVRLDDRVDGTVVVGNNFAATSGSKALDAAPNVERTRPFGNFTRVGDPSVRDWVEARSVTADSLQLSNVPNGGAPPVLGPSAIDDGVLAYPNVSFIRLNTGGESIHTIGAPPKVGAMLIIQSGADGLHFPHSPFVAGSDKIRVPVGGVTVGPYFGVATFIHDGSRWLLQSVSKNG